MVDQNGSILDTIKKLLGLEPEYTAFDTDIMIHINTVFSVLHHIGAAPAEGFMITGREETWDEYLANRNHVEMVKTYMYLKIRLVFDPPTTSFALDAFKKQADEFEWRLNTMELEFNPHAFDHHGHGDAAVIWKLTDGKFPEGVEDGDLGIDFETGDVWRDL